MNILVASSEVAPFAKTGGLADVAGSLPIELSRLGQNVAVIMPAFRQIRAAGVEIHKLDIFFDIPIGGKIVSGQLLRGNLPGSDVPIYFVDQPSYFDRPELYRESGEDYKDNCERFVFFCRAVMEAIRLADIPVDILHCNDWQTGLIPAFLEIEYDQSEGYVDIATLLTVHNLAYQGQFWHWDMLLTGLDWKYFNWHQMEFFGKLNLLKTGLVFANMLNTVSPRYAMEIQGSEQGCGLEGVLQQRSADLEGIINGVDYEQWSPVHDKHIAATYSADDWQEGKAKCKAALQAKLGLPQNPRTPLVGLVGRLASQKGWDLVAEVLQRWVPHVDMQWAILGTGEPEYHQLLGRLAEQWSSKVGLQLSFSNAMAHEIEAGSDIFLMPSRYEPCGLNQLYSLQYGSVPVVRSTGGLADTVRDANLKNVNSGQANGFAFEVYSPEELESTLNRARETYVNHPDIWNRIVEVGMKQDWSWGSGARKYIDLYRRTLARKRDVAYS